jgi:cytoskeletal protein CcmA (bactofilin family)
MADPKTEFTTIGPTLVVRGKLRAGEKLVIRGRIDAGITSTTLVVIEKDGIVTADIHARALLINGIVVGNLVAEERIELAGEARVIGDVKAPVIVVHDGAALRGQIDMPGVDEAMAAEASDAEPEASFDAAAIWPAVGRLTPEPALRPTPMAASPLLGTQPGTASVPGPAPAVGPADLSPPRIEEVETSESDIMAVEMEDEPDEQTMPTDQPRPSSQRSNRLRAGASSRLRGPLPGATGTASATGEVAAVAAVPSPGGATEPPPSLVDPEVPKKPPRKRFW